MNWPLDRSLSRYVGGFVTDPTQNYILNAGSTQESGCCNLPHLLFEDSLTRKEVNGGLQ